MSRRMYCRTVAGSGNRSVHLAVRVGDDVRPRCTLGPIGGNQGFETCRGPATCVPCRGIERNER